MMFSFSQNTLGDYWTLIWLPFVAYFLLALFNINITIINWILNFYFLLGCGGFLLLSLKKLFFWLTRPEEG